MKTAIQNSKRCVYQKDTLYRIINNISTLYTKSLVKLFGEELRIHHCKHKINVRTTNELSEHMKKDLGID
ncbi:hypothetical protein MTsN1n28_02830 [Vibrio alginolyticus]